MFYFRDYIIYPPQQYYWCLGFFPTVPTILVSNHSSILSLNDSLNSKLSGYAITYIQVIDRFDGYESHIWFSYIIYSKLRLEWRDEIE